MEVRGQIMQVCKVESQGIKWCEPLGFENGLEYCLCGRGMDKYRSWMFDRKKILENIVKSCILTILKGFYIILLNRIFGILYVWLKCSAMDEVLNTGSEEVAKGLQILLASDKKLALDNKWSGNCVAKELGLLYKWYFAKIRIDGDASILGVLQCNWFWKRNQRKKQIGAKTRNKATSGELNVWSYCVILTLTI